MKSKFNLAGFVTASAFSIGAVAHQYGTSYEEMCDEAVGSNMFASVFESVSGRDTSGAGHWVSVSGSSICNAVGAIERPVTAMSKEAMTLILR